MTLAATAVHEDGLIHLCSSGSEGQPVRAATEPQTTAELR